MRNRLVLLLVLWQVGTLAARAQVDSLPSPTRYSFYSNLYSLYEQQAGQVLFHPSTTYGLSSATAAFTNGDWRTYQMPGKRQQFEIFSRGAAQLSKVKVMGTFRYQRTLDDSVGWMLKPEQGDKSPYYLANQKPGNWDSHAYHLNGAGSMALTDHWHVVAGAALTLGSFGRFTDPRPQISRYRLKLNAGFGYKADAFGIVVAGVYGKGDEKTRVGYANTMNNTPGQPAYVTHDMMGYGYYRTIGSDAPKLNETQHTLGVNTVVQFHRLNIAHTFTDTERSYVRELEVNRNAPVGDVFQEQHLLTASYTFDSPKAAHLAAFQMEFERLSDFNHAIFQGNNYSGTALTASPAYQAMRGSWEYALSVRYHAERRRDGTAAVNYQTRTATLALGGGKLVNLTAGFLKFTAQAAYRADMGSSLQIGSQHNAFMKDVVLPDFAYYSSDQITGDASLGYGFNLKEVVLMPVLSYQLQAPRSSQSVPGAIFQPAATRNTFSFSLNIHL